MCQYVIICQKHRFSVMINTLCNIFSIFSFSTNVTQLVEVAAPLSMLSLGNPSPDNAGVDERGHGKDVNDALSVTISIRKKMIA